MVNKKQLPHKPEDLSSSSQWKKHQLLRLFSDLHMCLQMPADKQTCMHSHKQKQKPTGDILKIHLTEFSIICSLGWKMVHLVKWLPHKHEHLSLKSWIWQLRRQRQEDIWSVLLNRCVPWSLRGSYQKWAENEGSGVKSPTFCFWPLRISGMHLIHRHTCWQNTHT